MNLVDLTVALALFAIATGAALALPRWRTSAGPVLETTLLVLALVARGEGWLPVHWAASRYLPALVFGYILVRVHRTLVEGGHFEPAAPRPRHTSFDPAAIQRNVHLIALGACVLWEIVNGATRSSFRLAALPVPLFSPLAALFSLRYSTLVVVINAAGAVVLAGYYG
jgi:hypothetical protein